MARQVLPWVGAAVGFWIGGPQGAQWGFAIGSIVGNAVDPQVIKGPQLGEAGLQTSAEGVFRPIVFGTAPVKGNVIERGNRQIKTKRTRQSKGGGPVTEEQRVFWTFAIRICEGPIEAVTRIWMDEKLVYDVRPESTIVTESAEFAQRFRLYLGDEDQLPDPDLEAYKGIGNVNAYRGTAFAVFPNFDLTDYRERIPDFRWEVAATASTTVHTAVVALARLSDTGGAQFFLPSADGVDWSGSYTDDTNLVGRATYLIATDETYVAYTLGHSPAYLEGGSSTWAVASGDPMSESGGGHFGWYSTTTGALLIPGNSTTESFSRSYTKGRAFETLNAGFAAVAVVSLSATWMAAGNDEVRLSSNDGSTWGAPISIPLVFIGTPSRWATEDSAMLGGSFNTGTYIPRVLETFDGELWTVQTLPAFEPEAVGCDILCAGVLAGDEDPTWVMVTNNGQIAYRSPGGAWVLSADSVTGKPASMTFNGSVFVLTSGDAANGDTNAEIHYSSDPANWTLAKSTPLTGSMRAGGIASLALPDSALGGPFILGDFVAAMHQRSGHSTSDYDVSELTDEVDGIVLAGDYTCGSAIATMMPLYFFDASEHDAGGGYKIHYPKRGKPVVRTITIDDLIEAPEKTVREDALERPRVLHLHYESPQIGYAPAKATERRDSPDVLVVGERSFAVPVCFGSQDEPRQINRKLMKVVWTEVAGEEEFTIHDGHLDLVTADCIGVSLRGQVRRMRITQQWIGLGEIRLKLMPDRQSAYTADVTGVPLPTPTPPPASNVGTAVFDYLDIPALNDTGDRLLYYVAATGQNEAYAGTVVQLKEPSEIDFADELVITQPTVMGILVDDVAEASEHYTDTTNVVRVSIYRDEEIDSLTDAQFLSEGGSFALENADGTWELMQYRDAVDEGDCVFALSYLARGRLNSGTSDHSAGARFVLLDGVYSIDAVTAWLGQEITHRPVNIGRSPDGAPEYTDAYSGNSQIEFPCAHLFLDRDVDTIECETVPRHRFGTETHPVRSVNWLGYRWTATDGANTSTHDTTTATTTFDVTGWASPVTVTVAQLNRYTGAGPTLSEQIA